MIKETSKRKSLFSVNMFEYFLGKISQLKLNNHCSKYCSKEGSIVERSNEIIKKIRNNESVFEVANGNKLYINSSRLSSSGNATSEENSIFYGVNAGILAKEGAFIDIQNSTITTTGKGANAIFSHGDKSLINIDNVILKTKGDFSNGLNSGAKATVKAHDISINTEGNNSAAIAVYSENGIIDVSNAIATCEGENSPCVYSRGNIMINDSNLKAEKAVGAVIDGKSLIINNTIINSKENCGVMLFQDNDKSEKTNKSIFASNLGSIIAGKGALFFVTNTEAVVTLFNTKLIPSITSNILVNACKGKWGKEGENGGKLTLKGRHQTLKGDILCDELSYVNLNLKDYTYFTGIINERNRGHVSINLDSTSVWTVTGNSYIDYIESENEELNNIIDNGYSIYYNAKNEKNAWLNGAEYGLAGGGKLIPA